MRKEEDWGNRKMISLYIVYVYRNYLLNILCIEFILYFTQNDCSGQIFQKNFAKLCKIKCLPMYTRQGINTK